MSINELTKNSLEKAFSSQIANLYNVYFDSLTTANEDETIINNALNRFEKGLKLAKKALIDTKELSGVN